MNHTTKFKLQTAIQKSVCLSFLSELKRVKYYRNKKWKAQAMNRQFLVSVPMNIQEIQGSLWQPMQGSPHKLKVKNKTLTPTGMEPHTHQPTHTYNNFHSRFNKPTRYIFCSILISRLLKPIHMSHYNVTIMYTRLQWQSSPKTGDGSGVVPQGYR